VGDGVEGEYDEPPPHADEIVIATPLSIARADATVNSRRVTLFSSDISFPPVKTVSFSVRKTSASG
jgi:hypothetical protein